MIFLILSPFFIAVNVFYIYEGFKWLNVLGLPEGLLRVIKLTSASIWGLVSICIFVAFLLPSTIDRETNPALYMLRRVLKAIGNYHLAVLIYMGMFLGLVLIGRLVEYLIPALADNTIWELRRAAIGLVNIALIIIITLYGAWHAHDLKIKRYEVDLRNGEETAVVGEGLCPDDSRQIAGRFAGLSDKCNSAGAHLSRALKSGKGLDEAGKSLDEVSESLTGVSEGLDNSIGKNIRIALVADLHLGYSIDSRDMQRMVDIINAQEVDLVVIAGDIYDNEFEALDDPERLEKILGSIESKYGTYAVYGNHDIDERILGGFTFNYSDKSKASSQEMDELLARSGIRLLMDEYVVIDDSFVLYGRPDYSKPGRGIEKRRSPEELMNYIREGLGGKEAGAETEKFNGRDLPVIVIDHEPRQLQELADAGVAIDLGGHTHDGQFFPLNLTSRWFSWENSCGLVKKDNMYSIVTSGVGLFGPNVRIGTDAEVCIVDVKL